MDGEDYVAGPASSRPGAKEAERVACTRRFQGLRGDLRFVDILSRPFYLPQYVDTGDWIEIGHIGAYSLALRTRFNGFYPDTFVEVRTPFDDAGPAESLAAVETMAD